jgi:DNA-binding NarL/FixJ family response regulator
MLTVRQVEVIACVCAGWTDRQIAAELGLKPSTVARHMRNIFNKLAAYNRAEVACQAVILGLVLCEEIERLRAGRPRLPPPRQGRAVAW